MNQQMSNNSTPSLFLQYLYKLQGLSLQYLYKVMITILCLHCLYKTTSKVVHLLPSVQVSIQISILEDILYHLYKRISMVMLLLISLHISLLDELLQPYLLMSLRNGILQSSLLTSLQSNFVLTSLRKIFLRRFYKDIHAKMGIPSKPEMFVQGIQVKPEIPKLWVPL